MKRLYVLSVVLITTVSIASLMLYNTRKKKKQTRHHGKVNYLLNKINQFDPSCPIEKAKTPPKSWYTDLIIYDIEKNDLLMKQWHPVGNISQLKRVGDYISGEILDNSYLVIRDKDNNLRAFYNTCRHKASKIVGTNIQASLCRNATGNVKNLVCPYHGLHYGLDGKLLNARKMENTDLNYDDFGLIPINLKSWSIFVFINFDENAKMEKGWSEELERRLEESGISKLTYHSSKVDIINCNWKVYVDNYLDGGYHVPILHKDLTGQLSMDSYTTEIFDNFSIQSVSGAKECDRIGEAAIYGYIYPHFMINRYGPVLDTNYVIPLSVDKCKVIFDFYFDYSVTGVNEDFIKESISSSDKTQLEDVQVSESVQIGLKSKAYDVGRYAKGVEEAEFHFHKLLHSDYLKASSNYGKYKQHFKCSGESLSW